MRWLPRRGRLPAHPFGAGGACPRARFGRGPLSLTPADVEARLLELQSTRARLYKAWDVALVRAVRREAVIRPEMTRGGRRARWNTRKSRGFDAFSAAGDVICVQAEFQRRSEKGVRRATSRRLWPLFWHSRMRLKLRLTVRLHQLRWKPNPEHESEIESIQEGLGEIIESINELLRDVKIGVLQLSQSDNEIPRPAMLFTFSITACTHFLRESH